MTAVATPDTIHLVDPGTLIVAANVRADAKPDKTLATSIKNHGVLAPILAWLDDDGHLNVLDGQRRTIAAVSAGVAQVPVVVIPTPTADQQRIVEQLVLNDHREALTDADHLGAFQQLALFGMSADAIARKTQLPRKHIDAALTVAASPFASELVTSKAITLETAVAISEFDDSPEIAEHLISVAIDHPSSLPHELVAAEGKRAFAARRAAKVAELTEAGYTILPELPYRFTDAIGELDDLYVFDTNGGRQLLQDHLGTPPDPATPGLVAAIDNDWDYTLPEPVDDADEAAWDAYEASQEIVFTARYFIQDWAEHGYTSRYTPSQPGAVAHTDATKEVDEAAKAERRKVLANNKAWPAATEVRIAWIRDTLLAAPTPPSTASQLVAFTLIGALPHEHGNFNVPTAVEWLNLPGTGRFRFYADTVRARLEVNALDGERIALAVAVASIENAIKAKDSWRGNYQVDVTKIARYLGILAGWGYGLSDLEQTIIDENPLKAA